MVENGRAERVELDGGPDEPERLGALAARLLRGTPPGARQ
jgi:hypothetical protein